MPSDSVKSTTEMTVRIPSAIAYERGMGIIVEDTYFGDS